MIKELVRPLVRPLVRNLSIPFAGEGQLAFHALTRDPSNGEMAGVLRGVGNLAEARTSTIYQRDWNDIWRSYASNEPAYFGARRVTNHVLYSEELDQASWLKQQSGDGITAVITANVGLAPDGTMTADRLQCDLDGGTTTGDFSWVAQPFSGVPNPHDGSYSIYLQSNNGSVQNVLLRGALGGAGLVCVVTSEWQRFDTFDTALAASTDDISIGLRGAFGTDDTCDVLIWGGMVELSDGQPDNAASDYFKTLASAVSRTYATARRTNRFLQSDDINDESEWVKAVAGSGLLPITTPNFALAPDGTSMTAVRLQMDLDGGTGTGDRVDVIQSAVVFPHLKEVTLSHWVKSNTGSNQTISMIRTNGGTAARTVTPEWTQIVETGPAQNGDAALGLRLRGTFTDDTCDILVWNNQAELGQSPSADIITGDSIGSSGFDVPLSPYLYGGPAATNEITFSRDLTDAIWVENAGDVTDLITNGGFDTDTDWTKGDGWTIPVASPTVAHCDGTQSASSLLLQSDTVIVGKTYKVTFTVSNYSAGNVRGFVGNGGGTNRAANGTFTEYLTTLDNASFYMLADDSFVGDIDDVQVFEAVAQFDEVGLEGIENTATTLTDDDSSGFEYVEEQVVIPNDSNTHVLRVFIRKDDDVSRFISIILFIGNGGTDQELRLDVNTQTGATAQRVATGTVFDEVNDNGLWWEVLLSVANNTTGNVGGRCTINPAIGTVIGTANSAALGSCIVGNVEIHLDKSIAQVRGSTPIFTSGSTVTVNDTDLSFNDANHVDLEGAYYCEFKNVGMSAVDDGALLGLGGSGATLYTRSNGLAFRSHDGTTGIDGPAITLDADDVEYKVAIAYGDSNKIINTDGVYGTEDDYDGVFNNTENKLNVLHNDNGVAVPTAVMLMRNLRRYALSYADAQTKIDELMP